MTYNDKQFDNYVVFFSGIVVEAHGYDASTTRVFVRYKTGGQKRWSTVVSGEHSRSKTSAIIAMYDVSTTRVFVRYKTILSCYVNVHHSLLFFSGAWLLNV